MAVAPERAGGTAGRRIVRGLWPFLLAVFLSTGTALAQPSEPYKPTTGPYTVKQVDQDWRDEARQREVPVRIYLPQRPEKSAEKPAKFPVIVFSHGLGASREQYGYFGRHMAECGYIVIAPTHAGSDTTALKDWVKKHGGIAGGAGEEGWLKSSVDDPANLRNRPRDVSFIIDQLSVNPLLKSEADAEHVGVAGHSFGADTAMQIGGMTTNLPEEKAKSFRDPRVKAVLPMSPEGPGVMGIEEGSWANFAAPVLFLTGTRDYGQGERSATWRRAGFEHVAGVDSYLVILNGAGHMTFGRGPGETAAAPKPVEDSGKDTGGGLRERLRERVKDRVRERTNEKTGGPDADQARHTAMIESLSAAFFDAYVRGDASAKAWLKAFAAARHDDCTAESKAGTDKE